MQKKLQEEYVIKMHEQINNDDTEMAHRNADDLLCELLLKLGYVELVKTYEKVSKWYV